MLGVTTEAGGEIDRALAIELASSFLAEGAYTELPRPYASLVPVCICRSRDGWIRGPVIAKSGIRLLMGPSKGNARLDHGVEDLSIGGGKCCAWTLDRLGPLSTLNNQSNTIQMPVGQTDLISQPALNSTRLPFRHSWTHSA